MKHRTLYTSAVKPLTALLMLFASHSIVDAKPEEASSKIEIDDKAQVVKVQWAKAFSKKDNIWIRMRLSKSRFANLVPGSHIHFEIYGTNGNLLKQGNQELSPKGFYRSTVGLQRQQTIHYNTEMNEDIGISRIKIRTCQQKHNHTSDS